jgi:thiol-disulfide isomerase/thioredoxin
LKTGASNPRAQEIGGAVSDFALEDIRGGRRSLFEMLAGNKGAVAIFWSGVCSHCFRYDKYLNGFSERHPKLALLAIASRQGETPEQIRSTVKERGLTFPILHDPGSVVAQQWFTQQTPRAFLIAANQILLYRGAIDNYKYPDDPEYAAYLEPAIADFLGGQPVRRSETASFGCPIQSVYYAMPKNL